MIFHKRYKCNYWEDPASEWMVQGGGSQLTQMAALDIDHGRCFMPEMVAWRTARES